MATATTPNKGRRVRRYPLEAAATYVDGAPVLLDAAGELIEAGANPATILGFAAHDAVLTELDPDPGFALAFVAYPDATFLMDATQDPVAADVGTAFDLDVDANGVAECDLASSAAARLLVEDIYITPGQTSGQVEVSVLAANRQLQV